VLLSLLFLFIAGSSASSIDVLPRRVETVANQTQDVTHAFFYDQLQADGLTQYTKDSNLHVEGIYFIIILIIINSNDVGPSLWS